MTVDDLLIEAESLRRGAFLLEECHEGSPVAFWHGIRPGEPCLSLQHQDKWLTIRLDKARGGSVQVADSPLDSTIPLGKTTLDILPPVDAIFLRGSATVGRWLEANSWQRDWGYNPNFGDSQVVEAYERLWQQQHPLFHNRGYAICGGWHFSWPDDDWYKLINHELVVWTLRDAEPWIETWKTPDGYQVIQRQT